MMQTCRDSLSSHELAAGRFPGANEGLGRSHLTNDPALILCRMPRAKSESLLLLFFSCKNSWLEILLWCVLIKMPRFDAPLRHARTISGHATPSG